MIDENKLYKYYPKDLIEQMKKNYQKEYPDATIKINHETIRPFKGLMESLTGSQLSPKIELQLTILEDIIMNFLTPYTRQLLLERISKKGEERG